MVESTRIQILLAWSKIRFIHKCLMCKKQNCARTQLKTCACVRACEFQCLCWTEAYVQQCLNCICAVLSKYKNKFWIYSIKEHFPFKTSHRKRITPASKSLVIQKLWYQKLATDKKIKISLELYAIIINLMFKII